MAEDGDPYDVLLVCRSATAVDIRKSYQELARKVCSSELYGFFQAGSQTGHACIDRHAGLV